MDDEMRPGGRCPFTAIACQDGCWLWDMEDAPGECSAPREFPEAMDSPRDFYNACVMDAMKGGNR